MDFNAGCLSPCIFAFAFGKCFSPFFICLLLHRTLVFTLVDQHLFSCFSPTRDSQSSVDGDLINVCSASLAWSSHELLQLSSSSALLRFSRKLCEIRVLSATCTVLVRCFWGLFFPQLKEKCGRLSVCALDLGCCRPCLCFPTWVHLSAGGCTGLGSAKQVMGCWGCSRLINSSMGEAAHLVQCSCRVASF